MPSTRARPQFLLKGKRGRGTRPTCRLRRAARGRDATARGAPPSPCPIPFEEISLLRSPLSRSPASPRSPAASRGGGARPRAPRRPRRPRRRRRAGSRCRRRSPPRGACRSPRSSARRRPPCRDTAAPVVFLAWRAIFRTISSVTSWIERARSISRCVSFDSGARAGPPKSRSNPAPVIVSRSAKSKYSMSSRIEPSSQTWTSFSRISVRVLRLAVGREAHELVLAAVHLEAAEVRERRVEKAERVRETQLATACRAGCRCPIPSDDVAHSPTPSIVRMAASSYGDG